MDTKRFYKDFFKIAIPAAFQTLLSQMVILIDNFMVGSLGEATISAVSLIGNYTWFSSTFSLALGGGAAIIGSQYGGKQEYRKIDKLLSLNIVLSGLVGLYFYLACSINPQEIVNSYTKFPVIMEPALEYIDIIKHSFVINSVSQVILIVLRSVRSVKVGLYNTIFTLISKTVLNYLLIFGKFGMPTMGVKGAAIATLFSRIGEFVITVVYLLFVEKRLCFKIKFFNPFISLEELKQFIVVTFPILVTSVLGAYVSKVQTQISGNISTYYIAANSIVHTTWMIASCWLWGFSQGCNVMVGEQLGRNNYELAKSDSVRFIKISILIGILGGIAIQLILPLISSQYNVTIETLKLAKEMSYAACINVFFLSVSNMICEGILKSGGKTKKILYVELAANWLIAIPLGYILSFKYSAPAAIVYFTLRSANLIKTIWGLYAFKKGDWMATLN